MPMDDLMTSGEAARFLGCSPDAVRLYERSRRLAALRTAGGLRLFRRADVERFRRQLMAERDTRAPSLRRTSRASD
jgi:excisionase family DNA binding protein